ncbi:MAG: hypothetical protein ACXWAT_00295 [Methylobacter sp.]
MNTKLIIASIIAMAALGGGYYWLYADRDYASCVLNHIEDAKNEQASRFINRACEQKFPNYFSKYDNPYSALDSVDLTDVQKNN